MATRHYAILLRKPRSQDLDWVVIHRYQEDTSHPFVVASLNSMLEANNEWVWGHYFADRDEALRYFAAQTAYLGTRTLEDPGCHNCEHCDWREAQPNAYAGVCTRMGHIYNGKFVPVWLRGCPNWRMRS